MNSENQPYATTFPALFARNVAAQPDRLALVTTTCAITYADLDEQADRIAAALLAVAGRGPTPIGLLFGQEIAAFAATIAVLKSGNFYVTLDPLYPLARLAEILMDAGAGVLLTNTACLALAQQLCPEGVVIVNVDALPAAVAPLPLLVIAPDAYAYIGYTSGSTGKAKGVVETHGNHICHWQNLLRAQPNYGSERVLFLNRLSFSGGQLAFYLTLLAGATLYLYDLHTDGMSALPAWIQQQQITVWNSVPSVFRAFVAQVAGPEQVVSIRLLRLASDAILPQDLAAYRRLFSPTCQLWLCYALTEVKTVTMTFLARDATILPTAIPSGPPIDGMTIQIVDDAGLPLGPDQVGEIIVRSRYVSPGYWRDPLLTAARFRPDPDEPGVFLVQTGDLGKLDYHGNLIHKGRKDTQVKVRGYRVELSEIEAHLAALDGVQEAAMRAYSLASGEVRLAAYWVSRTSPPPSSSHLRRLLSQHLPDYMIPASFTLVERLPVNANGKLDRSALPLPGNRRPPLDTPFTAPRTVLEQALAAIWAELLELETVGCEDNFFALGGDSLIAMRLVITVEKRLGGTVPMTFLRQPTVAHLAALLTDGTYHRPDGLTSPPPAYPVRDRLAALAGQVVHLLRHAKSRLWAIPHRLQLRLARAFVARAFDRSYFAGVAWLMKWCKHKSVQRLFYPMESQSARRFAQGMGTPQACIDHEVQLRLVSRILLKHRQQQMHRQRTHPKRSLSVLYAELQQALRLEAMTPAWRRYFDVVGAEHLTTALQGGQGVILVGPHTHTYYVVHSFTKHLSPLLVIGERNYKQAFAKLFPNAEIPYQAGRQAARAAVAVDAHQVLTRNGVVVLAGDEEDVKHGYPVMVGNRMRHWVTGFAELAVVTGACLLLFYSALLDDGRMQLVICPALSWDTTGCHAAQVAQIMDAYSALLTEVWRQKPSIIDATNLHYQV